MHPLEEQQRLKGSAQEAAELAAKLVQEKACLKDEVETLQKAAAARIEHAEVEAMVRGNTCISFHSQSRPKGRRSSQSR